MTSPRFSITTEQVDLVFKSFMKYSSPLILLFLLELQKGTSIENAIPLLYGAGLQLAINFFSKYLSETK